MLGFSHQVLHDQFFLHTPPEILKKYRNGATLLSAEYSVSPAEGILLEVIMTFFLNFVVLLCGLRKDRPKESKVLGALAVAACVGSLVLFGGPITGASLNPGSFSCYLPNEDSARSFGPALVGGVWDYHYVYWIGPILGSVLASGVFRMFHEFA